MTIALYFSNRLEELAEKFTAIMARENREKENILEESLTIVPNQNLSKWLQLTLAKRQSVLMNMDFQYLDVGLWNLIAGLDKRDEKPAMMDHAFRQILLLYGLQTLDPHEKAYLPLTRYLLGSDGRRGPDYGVKLWQLTERMVHLFEEYEFHRSDMIQNWMDGNAHFKGMELCQQKLYLRLRAIRDGYTGKTGRRVLSLGEYATEILTPSRSRTNDSARRKFVHIFGLSQVSIFHLNVIGKLQQDYDIFIYALNPSQEFWEDIKTPRERRWIERKNGRKLEITDVEREQGAILEPEDNDLLALWGKPGRENIRLLCELTNYDFHSAFTKESSPESVLQKLQHSVLTLSTEKDTGKDKRLQDRSLQIIACPGIYREVETVYNNILYNLEKDKDLQLTDIAILVSDITKYKPVIDSFFNSGTGSLSYNLVDSRADTDSVYAKGILLLLALASGRFSRKEVFDLIVNPCFMEKWQIDGAEIEIWAGWVDDLNIFHSFDAKAKKKRGYPESIYYTWEQGLQRLRLSRILATPNEVGGERSRHFHGLVPFTIHTGDVKLMEKFSLILEKLHHAATEMAGLVGSGENWNAVFLRICDDLLEIPADFKGEAAVQHALTKAFLDIKTYDDLQEGASGKGRAQLNFEIMREFIKSSLGSISGGRGDYLTEGVTISALQPMRPIPFKIVYVLGMEEGSFPGNVDASSLDLRLLKRQIGDISVPEKNCYLFLEMLLSVREKLYISYLSRDLQKDRAIQPCSVVNQLQTIVERKILGNNSRFCIVDIPLKGSNEKYLMENADQAFSDVLVTYSLADRITFYREQGLWEEVDREISKEDRARLQNFFPDFGMKAQRSEKDKRVVQRISLKDLTKFLENPVSQAMRRHLGIYDEEETIEDIALREDEPFYSLFPVDYKIKTGALNQWLDLQVSPENRVPPRGETLKTVSDQRYKNFQRNSETPEGAYAELDQEALSEEVLARGETLIPVFEELRDCKKIYRALLIGEPADEHSSDNQLPILRFKAAKLTVETTSQLGEQVETAVELHGKLPWVWKEKKGVWHALVVTGSSKPPKKKEPGRYILEPLLFWMTCLTAEDERQYILDTMGNATITFHVAYKDRIILRTYDLNPDDAEIYLKGLVSEFLNQEKVEWLPFEKATTRPIKPHMAPYETDESNEALFREQLLEAYGEEEQFLIQLSSPHIPHDAYKKVKDRFRIFFSFDENTPGG